MSKKFLMVTVCTLLLVVSAPTAWAGNNGKGNTLGDTPADEGVCDILQDATPGLFGLCIAFCEAQDCVPDFDLPDPFMECRPGSQRVLDNYNRKKTDADPEMPCMLQTACPCWTEEELETLGDPGTKTSYSCTNHARYIPGNDYFVRSLDLSFQVQTPFWQSHRFSTSIFPDHQMACSIYQSEPYFSRYLPVTEEQYQACRDQLKQHATEWSFACFE